MKKYPLDKFFDSNKSMDYSKRVKKEIFIWEILKKNSLAFCLYVLTLVTVTVMGNLSPLIFEQLLLKWRSAKESELFIYFIVTFLCFQIFYSLVKNHSTHLKWKLITAIDPNTKNYIFSRLLASRKKSEIDKGELLNLYTLHSSNMRGIVEPILARSPPL